MPVCKTGVACPCPLYAGIGRLPATEGAYCCSTSKVFTTTCANGLERTPHVVCMQQCRSESDGHVVCRLRLNGGGGLGKTGGKAQLTGTIISIDTEGAGRNFVYLADAGVPQMPAMHCRGPDYTVLTVRRGDQVSLC